jgi:hypothetical protein
LRNTVEGTNGFIKDGAHEALADPSRRRVHGVAAQGLFVGLLAMAANVRKIRSVKTKARPERGRRARRRTLQQSVHPPDPSVYGFDEERASS